MTPTLSIIVISYNTLTMTLKCLHSVVSQTLATEFELLVVDNGSTDGSADAIEAECAARLRLFRSPTNLGFAAGNNRAIQEATGEYLLLLNPDTEVLDGAIDNLLAFATAYPAAGIWGGRTLFANGLLNPSSCWNRMTAWSVFCQVTGLSKAFPRVSILNPEAVSAWWRGGPREVDIVSGCFFLIRRELWDRLGGFDPSFFMYGEEADLCLRARSLGARPMVTPNAVIVHHGGASERVAQDKLIRLLNAKAKLIRRHWRPGTRRVGIALLSCWPLSRASVCSILSPISQRARTRASVWREVWCRRSEWSTDSDRDPRPSEEATFL